ncbi:hypothetical protein T01_7808 [Trichinella spiralis]|uniref:Uncharacterized protein n=1 Tax=Trichinella spiralis TaxID=6334 RepID=A0A0V1AJK4_TRISP|nr:hypothetical protein T01_7808 [Trichinella spiralis]
MIIADYPLNNIWAISKGLLPGSSSEIIHLRKRLPEVL